MDEENGSGEAGGLEEQPVHKAACAKARRQERGRLQLRNCQLLAMGYFITLEDNIKLLTMVIFQVGGRVGLYKETFTF